MKLTRTFANRRGHLSILYKDAIRFHLIVITRQIGINHPETFLVIIFANKQLIFVDEQASYTNVIGIGKLDFKKIILNIETINTKVFVSESSWKNFYFNIIM